MSTTPSLSYGHASSRAPSMAASAKVVLLGDSAVGKSSIALRFARNEFHDNQETTIGAAFMSRTLTIPPAEDTASSNDSIKSNHNTTNVDDKSGEESRSLKFEIWDTAGQERYRSLAPIYYRGAVGALIVYDITSADSFAKVDGWVKELRANGSPSLAIVLVGNKTDLDSERRVSLEEAQAFAAKQNVVGVYETSAKDGNNIEETFTQLGRRLLDQSLSSDPSHAGSSTGRGVVRRGAQRLVTSANGQNGEAPARVACCN